MKMTKKGFVINFVLLMGMMLHCQADYAQCLEETNNLLAEADVVDASTDLTNAAYVAANAECPFLHFTTCTFDYEDDVASEFDNRKDACNDEGGDVYVFELSRLCTNDFINYFLYKEINKPLCLGAVCQASDVDEYASNWVAGFPQYIGSAFCTYNIDSGPDLYSSYVSPTNPPTNPSTNPPTNSQTNPPTNPPTNSQTNPPTNPPTNPVPPSTTPPSSTTTNSPSDDDGVVPPAPVDNNSSSNNTGVIVGAIVVVIIVVIIVGGMLYCFCILNKKHQTTPIVEEKDQAQDKDKTKEPQTTSEEVTKPPPPQPVNIPAQAAKPPPPQPVNIPAQASIPVNPVVPSYQVEEQQEKERRATVKIFEPRRQHDADPIVIPLARTDQVIIDVD